VILRRAVPPALRALLLALAATLLAAPAQASLPTLSDLARASDEVQARPSALSADLPREQPTELPKECNGPFCVEQAKTRVGGFDLRLSCSIGGEGGLTCGSRRAYGLGYGGRAVERSVFTGHVFDSETGLYNAKARYFDPKLGRFLTQDSFLGQIDEPPSLHRYLYANDNPARYVDPTGYASFERAELDGPSALGLELSRYDEQDRVVRKDVTDRYGEPLPREYAPSSMLKKLLSEAGSKEEASQLLQQMRAGNYRHYAVTVLEESDFENGQLKGDKVFDQFIKQVGSRALAIDGLRGEFLAALGGAKVGESRDISFTYNLGLAYSSQQARAEVEARASKIPGVHRIQVAAGLAGEGIFGSGPREFAWEYGGQLASDAVTAASLGLGIYRLGAGALRGIAAEAAPKGVPTGPANNLVGREFDEYVAQTKLRGLDEAGQLGRQETLPTPDVPGRKYVRPDYTIYNPRGNVAAYADAKSGASIGLDPQARGLVQWSKTTTSKTLIYYTPEGATPISPELLRYAQQNGVRILQVAVP